jgi:uncharacterized protein (TIGR00290 family)
MAKFDKEPVLISWSGGKDSMLALHDIRASGEFEVVAALTTVSEEFGRICMHGVRRELLRRQTEALGLPLEEIVMPVNPSNADYEAGMAERLARYKKRGVRRVVFGDIFLSDLKKYREENLARLGMSGIFPLWLQDTRGLVKRFVALGYEAILACIDTRMLPESFAGHAIDAAFLNDLPSNVDPCGENGEFHSFVWNGPIFTTPLALRLGEKVLREPFMYCDLIEELLAAVTG